MAVLATDDRFSTWICNNYNNIVYTRYDEKSMKPWGDFHDIHYPSYGMLFEKIPFIESSRLNKSIVNIMCNNIKEFIIKCIDNEYYVYLALNNFYIPHSHAYQKQNFRHSTFIYGYNTDTDIVYIADFYKYRKYDFYTITFEQLNSFYQESMDQTDYCKVMNVFRIDKSYDIANLKIDLFFLEVGLKDYINSMDEIVEFNKRGLYNNGNPYFGLSYLDQLILDICDGQANIQAFHVLYDHAILMQYKINVLNNKKILTRHEYMDLKSKITAIVELCDICEKSFIKSLIRNIDVTSDLVQKILKLKEMNKRFIETLLSAINSSKYGSDSNGR